MGMKLQLGKVQQTLLITLYTRAMDSRAERPILGDTAADDILRQLDYDFARLKLPAKETFGNAIRTKQLDVWTAKFIATHPNAIILDLGCGLDGRVFRLQPPQGVDWYDIDYPEVIVLRQNFYPERVGNTLIGASLTEPGWLEQLPADRPVMIIADGVLPFLSDQDVRELFNRLTRHFQHGQLAFNGYTTLAVRLMKYHPTFKELRLLPSGGGIDDPRQPEQWAPRLKLVEQSSIIASPYIARTPPGYRLLCRLMSSVPALKKEGGWLLRYQF